MQRYFVDQPISEDQSIELPKESAHHFITVMRAELGSKCEVVLNNHQVYLCKLIQSKPATVQIIRNINQNVELPVHVILACGLPKTKDKPELIVQKGTELGADDIIFFESARSVSHWNSQKQAKKIARLQKIAQGAAEQSHRNRVPQVHYLPSLKALLDQTPAEQRLVAWEESAKQGDHSRLAQALSTVKKGQRILAIFGPEGGLTEDEVQQMTGQGVISIGLGPRILRTETAPLYFLSAVSFATELS